MERGVRELLSDYVDEKNIINIIEDYSVWSSVFIECGEDWDEISKYKYLSESFMRKYQDKLNWNLISKYQDLSIPFMEEFIMKLNPAFLFNYQLDFKGDSKDFVMRNCHMFPERIVLFYLRRNN